MSCIFSILVSRLFICNSIMFSRFWIIFTIIILNSFWGRLPISSSFILFGGHLSWSFICWVFLCLILFKLLSLGCPFCILAVCGVLYCGISSLCVGLYRCLVKVSWLGKLVSVFWWVELYFFSLECNEVSSNELWDVYGFGVTCILKLRVVFLCCWRICLVCLAVELVGPCVVLGFSVGMEAFDELLSINVPWSQEFPGDLQKRPTPNP